MTSLETTFANIKSIIKSVQDYFEIPEDKRDMNIVNEIYDDYWYVSDNCLNYAKTEDGFETGEYYCAGDDCDNAIYGQWEKDGYVAIKIGCGEHTSSELWVFRKDRMVDSNDIE